MARLSAEEKAICDRYPRFLKDIAAACRFILFNTHQQFDSLEIIKGELENLPKPSSKNMTSLVSHMHDVLMDVYRCPLHGLPDPMGSRSNELFEVPLL